jgi:hypothetical protein
MESALNLVQIDAPADVILALRARPDVIRSRELEDGRVRLSAYVGILRTLMDKDARSNLLSLG